MIFLHHLVNFKKNIAATGSEIIPCQDDDGNLIAQICLFGAQLIAGVGQSLKHTLGISYLDDNIKKSKTPALISNENEFKIHIELLIIHVLFRSFILY